MAEGRVGRAVTRNGVKGHMVTYSEYEKFVPEDYHVTHKKKTR